MWLEGKSTIYSGYDVSYIHVWTFSVLYSDVWDYLVIDPFTCIPSHPRFIHLPSYSILKYTGVRLYTEIISVKYHASWIYPQLFSSFSLLSIGQTQFVTFKHTEVHTA